MKCLVFLSTFFLCAAIAHADAVADLEPLLQQSAAYLDGEDVPAAQVLQAQRELCRRYVGLDQQQRDAFAQRLGSALYDAAPGMRVVAGRTLATSCDQADVERLLAAMATEPRQNVQHALARVLGTALRRLPADAGSATRATAASTLEQLIRDDTTAPDFRRAMLMSLGNAGAEALPALYRLCDDPRWSRALHWSLPAALAGTGSANALDELILLFETDQAVGFRVACIQAMGTLLARPDSADQTSVQAAVGLLRGLVLSGAADPTLKAAAAKACAKWPAASQDAEFVNAVCRQLKQSTGQPCKNYLRALLYLDVELDAETTSFVQAIAASDQTDPGCRKVAMALLDVDG
ncbi:MAG TPA: hypothetical protein VMZ31_03125 [Phycisphaerae bacterium]|nr:hypothetical protein [Phycisphaerae bacterium]